MVVKYLEGLSTGQAFTTNETRSVNVTDESLDISEGYEGDTVTYTATVLDSITEKLPATFVADLIINSTKLKDAQVFDAAVYNQTTGLLTLICTVPAAVGVFAVKLDWPEQII